MTLQEVEIRNDFTLDSDNHIQILPRTVYVFLIYVSYSSFIVTMHNTGLTAEK